MQFSSWNVNGLRAVQKKGIFPHYIEESTYDVVFLMETKCELDQLSGDLVSIPNYSFTLQPSQYKKGYAGVGFYLNTGSAAFATQTAWAHNCNLYDEERILTTSFVHPKHGRIAITGCYFPNGARGASKRGGDMETKYRIAGESLEGQTSAFGYRESGTMVTSDDFPANLDYKLAFFDEFLRHVNHLRKHHDHVFICGDINICHNVIDIARPESNKNSIGFLPVERARLDTWTEAGWVDIFRKHNPEGVVYSWWDVISRARERNVGWRIDSWWCHEDSLGIVESVSYETGQMGSDHCPVVLRLK